MCVKQRVRLRNTVTQKLLADHSRFQTLDSSEATRATAATKIKIKIKIKALEVSTFSLLFTASKENTLQKHILSPARQQLVQQACFHVFFSCVLKKKKNVFVLLSDYMFGQSDGASRPQWVDLVIEHFTVVDSLIVVDIKQI